MFNLPSFCRALNWTSRILATIVPKIRPKDPEASPDIAAAGKLTPYPWPLIPVVPEAGVYHPERADPGGTVEPPVPPGVTYKL